MNRAAFKDLPSKGGWGKPRVGGGEPCWQELPSKGGWGRPRVGGGEPCGQDLLREDEVCFARLRA